MAGLDLRSKRRERTGWDEATGASGNVFPITFGDTHLVTLEPEMPLTALAPLKSMGEEISLIIIKAIEVTVRDSESDNTLLLVRNVIDILVAYPDVLINALDLVEKVGRNILTDTGWETFVSINPSKEDVTVLISAIAEWYGVTPGEAFGSSDSSTDDGTTSTSTSEPTAESTPDVSSSSPQDTPT